MLTGNPHTHLSRTVGHLTAVIFVLLALAAPCSVFAQEPDPHYRLRIGSLVDQLQAHFSYLDVTLEPVATPVSLTGFDVLIGYDRNALHFREMLVGSALEASEWEYFTYHWGPTGDCHGECPLGVVRVVGWAGVTGSSEPFDTPRTLFQIKFLTTSDRIYECMFVPVRWYWLDCLDNILSTSVDGEEVVSRRVYDASYPPNEPPLISESWVGYPTYQGIQNECIEESNPLQRRVVDFYNGSITFICANQIDTRGDVNANGIVFEIADYVMLQNYFLQGSEAFQVDFDRQLAYSECNLDGFPGHVSDLVYMLLVVTGAITPISEPTDPYAPAVDLRHVRDGNSHSLELISADTLGGLFMTIEGEVVPTFTQPGGTIGYAYANGYTRLLVVGPDLLEPVSIVPGQVLTYEVLSTTPYAGRIDTVEVSTVDGGLRSVWLDVMTGIEDADAETLPDGFQLAQNFPNPFNPNTRIGFQLPRSAAVELAIYNAMGQKIATLVRRRFSAGEHSFEWDGRDDSGTEVASGIYLYRLTADDLSVSRKMILLK